MKRVRIAEFKARLSEHLRAVRRGESLIVMDRDHPIARVTPHRSGSEPLMVREPAGHYGSLHAVSLPRRIRIKGDIVELLLEERQVDR